MDMSVDKYIGSPNDTNRNQTSHHNASLANLTVTSDSLFMNRKDLFRKKRDHLKD